MKQTLRDKAAALNFDDIAEIQKEQAGKRMFGETAPGQTMQNSVLRAELEQWSAANPVRLLDSKTVLRSKWANRHGDSFEDEEFKGLKADIENANGNVQPIKVRPVADKPGFFEVIFGHRRHQACLELGIPVLALIEKNVSDAQMFAEMERENRMRKDLRPYEVGMMYDMALKEKMFPSAKKMAEAIGANLGMMGKALLLARLPDYITGTFKTPLELQFRWADGLHTAAAEKAPETREIAEAIRAEKMDLNAREIYERLAGITPMSKAQDVTPKVVLEGSQNRKGTILANPADNSVVVSLKNIPADKMDQLKAVIEKFLKED